MMQILDNYVKQRKKAGGGKDPLWSKMKKKTQTK